MSRLIFILLLGSLFLVACGGTAVSEPTSTPEPTQTPTPAPTPTPDWVRDGWTLVWQDEFDGSAIDTTKWNFETGGTGWGNAESQYYTDFPTNAFIEDGQLVIQANEESHRGKRYTSARMTTQGKFEPEYGRIEIRAQIPTGQGIWPALWMLGANIDTTGWPHNGEIDIMENVGHEPTLIHGTVHGPGYSGGDGIGVPFSIGEPFYKDFYTYSIEWEENEIRWYVDDLLYHTLTPDDVPGEWVYDHPFFLLMNVAVGGYWPGYPDETTEFPQQMRVEYVRVYEKEE